MTQDFKEIIVLSMDRSGTNYLADVLGKLEGSSPLFEIFREGHDYGRLKPIMSSKQSEKEYGFDFRKLLPEEINEFITSDRAKFFDFLSKTVRSKKKKSFSCKIFPHQMPPRDLEKILARKDVVVIFLTRNRMDRYISTRKALAVDSWHGKDTTDIVIDFDVADFLKREMYVDRSLDLLFEMVKKSGRPYTFLRYETDLDQSDAIARVKITSALRAVGINSDLLPGTDKEIVFHKQDRNADWRDKVKDGWVVASKLDGMGLLHYAETPHLFENLPEDLINFEARNGQSNATLTNEAEAQTDLAELKTAAIPYGILRSDPLITFSGIIHDRSYLAEWLGNGTTRVRASHGVHFLHPTWTMETCDLSSLARAIKRAHASNPNHRFVVLYVSLKERDRLREHGIDAIAGSGHIFVNDEVWTGASQVVLNIPQSDAVYAARFIGWKNHHLAAKVASLSLIYDAPDESHGLSLADLSQICPQATFVNHTLGAGQYYHLSPAEMLAAYRTSKTSLALSFAEGAMSSVTESQLAGLPVISVPSTDGRDLFFCDDNALIVEPTAEAIAAGVAQMISRRLTPREVSQSTLHLLRSARLQFEHDANQIIQQHLGPLSAPIRVAQMYDVFGKYQPFSKLIEALE